MSLVVPTVQTLLNIDKTHCSTIIRCTPRIPAVTLHFRPAARVALYFPPKPQKSDRSGYLFLWPCTRLNLLPLDEKIHEPPQHLHATIK